MKKRRSICFVAGKSGGHIVPALTLAKQFIKEYKHNFVLFFSTSTSLDNSIIERDSFISKHSPLHLMDIPYKKIWLWPFFIAQFMFSLIKSLYFLIRYKPEKIISMGGLVSLPVSLTGRLMNIPIELYELNAVPGRAIHFLAPYSKTINICFPESKKYLPANKCNVTQYPIRFEDEQYSRFSLLPQFGFEPNKKTVFIFGGSQGSLFINSLIKEWVEKRRNYLKSLQIIHQIGMNEQIKVWKNRYNELPINSFVFDYYQHINQLYTIADLVICRAGAGSLFETLYFKKSCITIPHETELSNHQKNNAQAIGKLYPQLFTILEQNKLKENPTILFDEIENILL